MEDTNREVKIAIIVGLIMITLCAIAIIAKKINNQKVEDLNIHVYRHVITNQATNSGVYYECNVPTDKKSLINLEFKKVMNLKDSDKRNSETNEGIEGNYKITVDSNFIAFDDSKGNVVYRNDTTSLYTYHSSLYGVVEEVCKDIDLSNKEDNKDTKKEDKKDTSNKQDTKKDTKKTNKK